MACKPRFYGVDGMAGCNAFLRRQRQRNHRLRMACVVSQITQPENTTSLKKWPPCMMRAAPMKLPAATPAASQVRRRRRGPHMPQAIQTKPPAAWPLTNEQLSSHNGR